MADGRHFENSIISISQLRFIRFQSNLVRRCTSLFRGCIFDKKNWNFSNSRWRTDAILKMFFGYISVPYWPIYAKFRSEMENHMPIQDTWPKLQFSKIQDGGRPPIWKLLYLHISAVNYPISLKLVHICKFLFRAWNFDQKNRNFSTSRWRTDAILKIVFWLYLDALLAD